MHHYVLLSWIGFGEEKRWVEVLLLSLFFVFRFRFFNSTWVRTQLTLNKAEEERRGSPFRHWRSSVEGLDSKLRIEGRLRSGKGFAGLGSLVEMRLAYYFVIFPVKGFFFFVVEFTDSFV